MAAAGIIGNGQDNGSDIFSVVFFNPILDLYQINITFERMRFTGLQRLGDGAIDRRGAGKFDIGPGCVKVRITQKNFGFACSEE